MRAEQSKSKFFIAVIRWLSETKVLRCKESVLELMDSRRLVYDGGAPVRLFFESHAQNTAGDEGNANPLSHGVAFAKKAERKDGDKNKTEFVYRGDV